MITVLVLLLRISVEDTLASTNPDEDFPEKIGEENRCKKSLDEVRIASWIVDKPDLHVTFTHRAEKNLAQLDIDKLRHLSSVESVRRAICDILRADPRSNYRRQKCFDRLYYFDVDKVHVTCWFDTSEDGNSEIAEILKVEIKPNA
jgi:hypothetical protein